MKAVILAGGEATRLRPLTCNTPKIMVPVLNRPFLEHLVGYLKKHNIVDIILAVGKSPEQVQDYFDDGSKFNVRIVYSIEDFPMGTAGAVKNAERFLDDSFIVFNGDIFTGIDLSAMMRLHRKRKAIASLALTPVEDPTIYGVVEADSQGRVKRFTEKPSWDKVTTNMINAGIYTLEPDILSYITPNSFFEGESFVHSSAQIEGPVIIGGACFIDRNSIIRGPAVLGAGCRVEEGAIVEGAILWQDCKIGKGAKLRNCLVASRCFIGEESEVLDDCILGDDVLIGKGNKLSKGIKIWPGKSIEPDTISF